MLPIGTRDTFLWDDELRGFGLKVTAAGSKSFVFQYRMGGREAKTRRWTIGSYGSPWSPATARTEAERIATLVAKGIDPADADRERRRQAVDLAFETYAAKFEGSCAGPGWKRMVERTLRIHAVPILGKKALPLITRADISEVLDRLPTGQQALRRNTFAVLRRLFRWAVGRGDLERSPCEGMETPAAVKARDRVLDDGELLRVWLASANAGKLFGPIVRLLIVTGQRREEVTGLRWDEVDRAKRVWTLPGSRSKMSCCRFRGHRDKVFYGTGGYECNDASSAASSSSRR
jgi:integrase